jgi:hypothetical protein
MGINGVDDTGALLESYIEGVQIHGQYDAATNRITFNDARQPGETLWVSFYSGYVMPTGEGGVCAMAGTYTEQELIFEEGAIARGVSNRDVAGLGGILVRPTLHAAWYAIWQGNIIE